MLSIKFTKTNYVQMKPDFNQLNKKFPNRNWGEIYRRIQNGEPVASSLKMAIQRYTPNS